MEQDQEHEGETNKSPDEPTPETPQVKTKRMISQELRKYINLRKEFKEKITSTKEVYLINKHWLRAWKKATDYSTFKYHSYDDSYEFSDPDDPFTGEIGPIENEPLLLKDPEYITIGKKETIVIPSQYVWAKETSKEIWEFFREKYKGGPEILIPVAGIRHAGYYDNLIYDIQYIKVSFTILPKKKEFQNDEKIAEMKYYVTYISMEKKMSEKVNNKNSLKHDSNLFPKSIMFN